MKPTIGILGGCGPLATLDLGCTELPLILPHIDLKKINAHLIDPNAIVAKSLVSLAHTIGKKKTDISSKS